MTTTTTENLSALKISELAKKKEKYENLIADIDKVLKPTEQRATLVNATPTLLSDLFSSDPPPLDEVLPGLPAGKVGVLSGRGGRGKSLLLLRFLLSVAGADNKKAGLNAEDVSQEWELIQAPRRAVYLSLEDDANEVHRRASRLSNYLRYDLKLSQAELTQAASRVEIYPLAAQLTTPLLYNEDFPEFVIEHLLGVGLIVIDTLRLAHDKEENSSSEMSQLFRKCALLAEQTGASVLLASHENKGGGEGSDAVRGSTSIVDSARWVCRLRPVSKEETAKYALQENHQIVVLEVPKLNYRRSPSPLFLSLAGGVAHPVNLSRLNPTGLQYADEVPF